MNETYCDHCLMVQDEGDLDYRFELPTCHKCVKRYNLQPEE